MRSVYFDTSVFLAIFKGEPEAKEIRQLFRELKSERIRAYTSIITIEEVSVLSFRYGTVASDNYSKVSRLARIVGITKETALTAAKFEAQLISTSLGPEMIVKELPRTGDGVGIVFILQPLWNSDARRFMPATRRC